MWRTVYLLLLKNYNYWAWWSLIHFSPAILLQIFKYVDPTTPWMLPFIIYEAKKIVCGQSRDTPSSFFCSFAQNNVILMFWLHNTIGWKWFFNVLKTLLVIFRLAVINNFHCKAMIYYDPNLSIQVVSSSDVVMVSRTKRLVITHLGWCIYNVLRIVERGGNIINNRLTVSDYNSQHRMQLAISWMDRASSKLMHWVTTLVPTCNYINYKNPAILWRTKKLFISQ